MKNAGSRLMTLLALVSAVSGCVLPIEGPVLQVQIQALWADGRVDFRLVGNATADTRLVFDLADLDGSLLVRVPLESIHESGTNVTTGALLLEGRSYRATVSSERGIMTRTFVVRTELPTPVQDGEARYRLSGNLSEGQGGLSLSGVRTTAFRSGTEQAQVLATGVLRFPMEAGTAYVNLTEVSEKRMDGRLVEYLVSGMGRLDFSPAPPVEVASVITYREALLGPASRLDGNGVMRNGTSWHTNITLTAVRPEAEFRTVMNTQTWKDDEGLAFWKKVERTIWRTDRAEPESTAEEGPVRDSPRPAFKGLLPVPLVPGDEFEFKDQVGRRLRHVVSEGGRFSEGGFEGRALNLSADLVAGKMWTRVGLCAKGETPELDTCVDEKVAAPVGGNPGEQEALVQRFVADGPYSGLLLEHRRSSSLDGQAENEQLRLLEFHPLV